MRLAILQAILATLVAPAVASYIQDHNIPVEKTVTLPNGQVIDWVKRELQGKIASPPPAAAMGPAAKKLDLGTFDESTIGPDGTVPIPRGDGNLPLTKVAPPGAKKASRIESRQNQGKHWYSSTAQTTNTHGSYAALSMFQAYVQSSGDFSLLQTAVIRSNVPGIGLQAVEAGWVSYPDQVQRPHLFSFYTTNNYQGYGDNVCAWNTEYKGWVQVDNKYYPGMQITPLSVVNGDQHDLQVQYKLFQGNWWLAVGGVWIGYYPANMFVTRGNPAQSTLSDHSDMVNWYGEIYQSEGPLTTTDMGSGHFAAEGFGKAGYIRNIMVTGTNDQDFAYDGSRGVVVSDQNRYTIDLHFNSGTTWGSYFYLGGPGAGGVIGG